MKLIYKSNRIKLFHKLQKKSARHHIRNYKINYKKLKTKNHLLLDQDHTQLGRKILMKIMNKIYKHTRSKRVMIKT